MTSHGYPFDSRVGRDPIQLPGLASIIGERLFKSTHVGTGAGNHESHIDCPAVQRLLAEKLTTSILEFADGRLSRGAGAAIGEIETPLVRFRVVETQG